MLTPRGIQFSRFHITLRMNKTTPKARRGGTVTYTIPIGCLRCVSGVQAYTGTCLCGAVRGVTSKEVAEVKAKATAAVEAAEVQMKLESPAAASASSSPSPPAPQKPADDYIPDYEYKQMRIKKCGWLAYHTPHQIRRMEVEQLEEIFGKLPPRHYQDYLECHGCFICEPEECLLDEQQEFCPADDCQEKTMDSKAFVARYCEEHHDQAVRYGVCSHCYDPGVEGDDGKAHCDRSQWELEDPEERFSSSVYAN